MQESNMIGKSFCPSSIIRHAKFKTCLILISVFIFSACSYNNKPILLKTPNKIKTYGAPIVRFNSPMNSPESPYFHRIQPDNRIKITQLNPDLSEAMATLSLVDGYLVDVNGNIRLPVVGEVYVQGLTRIETAKLLEKVFGVYYKNPVFQVEISNLFVMVLGEGGTNTGSSFVPLDKERTHLLEVLGKAGGIPNFTKVKYVRIIRGDYRDPQILIVDMSQLSVIQEEDLIMQNGDFVYLEPKGIRLVTDAITPYIALFAVLNFFGTILLISNSFGIRLQNN
jgi:protein involved in polysaccharide export with SLBB domain